MGTVLRQLLVDGNGRNVKSACSRNQCGRFLLHCAL